MTPAPRGLLRRLRQCERYSLRGWGVSPGSLGTGCLLWRSLSWASRGLGRPRVQPRGRKEPAVGGGEAWSPRQAAGLSLGFLPSRLPREDQEAERHQLVLAA